MREILFRGKCKETGKWYTGQYINLNESTLKNKEERIKGSDQNAR